MFPDDAEITSVIPLDKGKTNKNEISNFRPVSILNISKIYEKFIKDQLVSGLDKVSLAFHLCLSKSISYSTCLNTLNRRMERTT